MKKIFPLTAAGKADARVIEAIKHDVRKYVNRERRKPLPEGFDIWEFSCKAGLDQATAESKPLRDVGPAIDAVASGGASAVYLEILAVPSHRSVPASTTAVQPPPPSASDIAAPASPTDN